jgi:hypothetical protein
MADVTADILQNTERDRHTGYSERRMMKNIEKIQKHLSPSPFVSLLRKFYKNGRCRQLSNILSNERHMMTNAEKRQGYRELIREALKLIELYDLEIRNAEFCPQGFCNGRLFLEGKADIAMKLLCIEHDEKYDEKDK